jgi:hypothetical protein
LVQELLQFLGIDAVLPHEANAHHLICREIHLLGMGGKKRKKEGRV